MVVVFILSIALLLVANTEAFKLNLGFPQIVRSSLHANSKPKTFDVYIGNVDYLATKESVQDAMLQKLLGYQDFFLVPFNETSHKGYGFFRFNNAKLAANMKALDQLVINNRTIRVVYQSMNVVTFSNLDPSITAPILKKICDDTIAKGCIEKMDLPTHPTSGMALGYALITFSSDDIAQKAIKTLNGIHLLNRPLILSLAPNREEDPEREATLGETAKPVKTAIARPRNPITSAPSTMDALNNGPNTVFVHNIDRRCTPERFESELLRILGEKVKPLMARLCTDKSGKVRGYGFVRFGSEADVSVALPLLNAAWIMNRFIVAEVTKESSESSAGKMWFKRSKAALSSGSRPETAAAGVTVSSVDESESVSEASEESEESEESDVTATTAVIETSEEEVERIDEQPEETKKEVQEGEVEADGEAVEEEVAEAVMVVKPKRKRAPAKKRATAAEEQDEEL